MALDHFDKLGFFKKKKSSHPANYLLSATVLNRFFIPATRDIFYTLRYHHRSYMKKKEIQTFFSEVSALIFNHLELKTFSTSAEWLINFEAESEEQQKERIRLLDVLRILTEKRYKSYKNNSLLKDGVDDYYKKILAASFGGNNKIFADGLRDYIDNALEGLSRLGSSPLSRVLNNKLKYVEFYSGREVIDDLILEYYDFDLGLF